MPQWLTCSLLLALLIAVLAPDVAAPHGGGLDRFGCHHDSKHGGYHCHQGPLTGQQFASQAEMLAVLKQGSAGPDKATKGSGGKRTCVRDENTGKLVCGTTVP